MPRWCRMLTSPSPPLGCHSRHGLDSRTYRFDAVRRPPRFVVRRVKRSYLGIALAAALACSPAEAAKAAKGLACAPVAVSTRPEHLSKFLEDLAAVRTIRVKNWSGDDPIVSLYGDDDLELMTALSQQVNLLVRYRAEKNCPGHWTIDTMWVLPAHSKSLPSAAPVGAAVPFAAASAPAPSGPAINQAMTLYMQAHGGSPH